MDLAEQVLKRIALVMAAAGGIILIGVAAITCVNIGMRFMGSSLDGTVEISGYLCAMAIGLCLPEAQMRGVHIEVGVLSGKCRPAVQKAQQAFVAFIGAMALALVAREIWQLAEFTMESGEYIEGSSFSALPMMFGFLAGVLMQALLCLYSLLGLVRGR